MIYRNLFKNVVNYISLTLKTNQVINRIKFIIQLRDGVLLVGYMKLEKDLVFLFSCSN